MYIKERVYIKEHGKWEILLGAKAVSGGEAKGGRKV